MQLGYAVFGNLVNTKYILYNYKWYFGKNHVQSQLNLSKHQVQRKKDAKLFEKADKIVYRIIEIKPHGKDNV